MRGSSKHRPSESTLQAEGIPTPSAAQAQAASSLSPVEKDSPFLPQEMKMEVDNKVENINDDIKPDVYEIQQQWLSHTAEISSTSCTEAMPAPASPENTNVECVPIIDKFGGGVTSELHRVSNQTIGSVEGKPSNDNNTQTPTLGLKPSTVGPQEFNFDADEVDMQESDSDEDGYSDIDFEEEFELIECDGDLDIYAPVWSQNFEAERKNFSNKIHNGTFESFARSNLPTYYFYKLLGSPKFFKRWAECCNKRVAETIEGSHEPPAITANEMCNFYGICLQMCSLQLTTLTEYWEYQEHHGFSGFSSKMSLERFRLILKFLNFEGLQPEEMSNKNDDQRDNKFIDMHPLLQFFNNRMEASYNCDQRIVLNEPIIYWKGNLNWANDINQKFHYNAITLHLLTEQSGIVLKLLADMESPKRKDFANNSRELVVERLSTALELLNGKFHKGHIVITSKYYGSYALCLELAKVGTYSSGLLDRQRFGNSKELVHKNLDQYQFETRYSGFVMMGKNRCQDKSLYFYSSDCLVISLNEIEERCQLQLIKEIKWQLSTPHEVRADMLGYQLALERTEIKWDRRLMIFVMNLVLLNAFLLYRKHAQSENVLNKPHLISYQKFRQEIITSLLNPIFDWNSADAANQVEINVLPDRVHEGDKLKDHQPMELPRLNGKGLKKRCIICNKSGLVTFSKVCCRICPGMPALCAIPCFKIWHDQIRRTWQHFEIAE